MGCRVPVVQHITRRKSRVVVFGESGHHAPATRSPVHCRDDDHEVLQQLLVVRKDRIDHIVVKLETLRKFSPPLRRKDRSKDSMIVRACLIVAVVLCTPHVLEHQKP